MNNIVKSLNLLKTKTHSSKIPSSKSLFGILFLKIRLDLKFISLRHERDVRLEVSNSISHVKVPVRDMSRTVLREFLVDFHY